MTRLVVVIGFVISFAAGLVLSRQTAAPPNRDPDRSGGPGGRLVEELGLTPEQAEQMRAIWSQAGGDPRARDDQRRQLYRQREEAVAALIRPEDKPKYDAVMADFDARLARMDEQRRSAFDSAVAQTREILNPEQRARYEELLRRHDRGRGPGGPGERHRGPREHRRSDSAPETKPAAEPAGGRS